MRRVPPYQFAVPAAVVAAVLLGSLLSGTDYLAYYLPAAQYLFDFHQFPPTLLPSRVDGPFAYPPAEFLLLAPTFLAPSFQALLIKLIAALKCALLFFLIHRLASHSARPQIAAWIALVPTLVMYLFIYNTDINIVLATLATVLLHRSSRYRWTAVALVTYAVMTKYTAWPLYLLGIGAFAITRRKELPALLVPILFILPFLLKNQLYYGNPLFPMFHSFFSPLAPPYDDLVTEWTTHAHGWRYARNLLRGAAGALIFSVFLYHGPRRRPLLALVGAYTLLWAIKMNPNMSGDATRFLLPMSVIVLAALAQDETVPWRRLQAAVIAQLGLFALLGHDPQTAAYAIVASAVVLTATSRHAALALIAAFLLIGTARLARKMSLNPQDLGYSPYAREIETLESIARKGQVVFTDLHILPLDVSGNPRIIVDRSILTSPAFLDLVYRRPPGHGPDFLLVEPRTFKHYHFDPECYAPGATIRGRTLYERRCSSHAKTLPHPNAASNASNGTTGVRKRNVDAGPAESTR